MYFKNTIMLMIIIRYATAEEVRTPTTVIDGYPWRFLIYPKGRQGNAVGVFLEIDHEHEQFKFGKKAFNMFVFCKVEVVSSTNPKWNAGKIFRHRFNDTGKRDTGMNWGFKGLVKLEDLVDPERGYLGLDDTCTFRATVWVTDGGDPNTWKEDSTYDSWKKTKMVGIQNQGTTCYMNSVLQTLYHTGALRLGVFQMPTESEEDADKSVALGIQRVFYRLQMHKEAVSTEELTKSFGWNAVDSFTQHDVQEFLRVLLDNMEKKMKGTTQEKLLQQLYEGKFKSYIRCTEVEYESSRTEPFLDLQLRVKGIPDLIKSFEDYCEVEKLDGENQYRAEGHGMQDANKGVIFEEFPPVLNIQLRRFEYDMMRDESYKVHDRFEYPDKMNLDKFLAVRGSTPANYTLHSVLVQLGDVSSGHYIVYTRPVLSGDWFKFDDENCVRVSAEEAIEGNFGQDEQAGRPKIMSSAYMLVYVRDDKMSELLPTIKKEHIPQHLHDRFEEEEEKAEMKRVDEESALSYMTLVLVQERDLVEKHQKQLELPALVNPYGAPEALVGTAIKVEKSASMKQLYEQVHEELTGAGAAVDKPIEALRLFPFERRENATTRPGDPMPAYTAASASQRIPDQHSNGKMFGKHKCILVAVRYADEPPVQDPNDARILICCKFYDATKDELQVIKFVYPKKSEKIRLLHDEMVEVLQLPAGTQLECLEELKRMNYTATGLDNTHATAQLQHGDILVWSLDNQATAIALKTLCSEITVNWRDLSAPEAEGITMKLDNRMTYDQTVERLAKELDIPDPQYIQLTTHEPMTRYNLVAGPGDKVLSTTTYKLRDIAYVPYTRKGMRVPIIYYEKIATPIAEFESLTEFDVQLLDTTKAMSVTSYKVHGPANQTCANLIQQVLAAAGSEWPLMNCRLVQTYWNRYATTNIPHDKQMSALPSHYEQYRVELIPEDERSPAMGVVQKRAQVVHVTKMLTRRHGLPFLFMLQDKETVKGLRARLLAYAKAPKAEFAKWQLGYLVQFKNKMGTMEDDIEYFEGDDVVVDFAKVNAEEPMLILDHVDKSKAESSWANPGAIKIHN